MFNVTNFITISEFVGKVFTKIKKSNDKIYFYINESEYYKMFHEQSCCETVVIEDIFGELSWLENTPILLAEERTSEVDESELKDRSATWTFYEIATIKGSVTIRWYGYSNGYYSESVDISHYKIGEN